MSLLDLASPPPERPFLVQGPVRLRTPETTDFAAWAKLREDSRKHLTAWEPDWRSEDVTLRAFRLRLRAYGLEMRRRAGLPLFVFRRADNTLVGGVTLSHIRYGASRSASIGYWIGQPFIRKGYARAAISAVLDHAFTTLGLNRVEAACQPENLASRKLLESLGFTQEGVARDYLFINGAWRDHLLFAITASDHLRSNRRGVADEIR